MAATPESNGRVTLAIIQKDIGHLSDDVEELSADVRRACDNYEKRIAALEVWSVGRQVKWDEHDKQHERETLALKMWSALVAGAAALIASLIGIFGKKP